ncbi:iron-containing alcohol dehydrogenase [Methanocaldococcus sp.]|uniref:iron-containing alcohol dehydrogenase n=1 Tax=Methanocaldococcus sp. TaxID=2152917 RepID=UPI00261C35A8|nr:iron-containing alcohol dehydrogenase [Methanocaldococcus sp.]MCQ6254422.1 iron-containing alcohol dehydrogenase [Methanocaldococcus sp.]
MARYEGEIDINNVFELRCKPTCYFGVGAINKIDDIFKEFVDKGMKNVLFVTGKSSYKKCGAWDVVEKSLEKYDMNYAIYNKVSPNPTVDMIDEAVALGREINADIVVGIGGGSPIDTAKGVAVLLEYPNEDGRSLYEYKFTPEKAKPIVAINTTHGTGTEVDRFAVANIPEKNYKPALVAECIYPKYSIDDPALLTGLPKKQTLATTIDALNHVTEAATTITRSPYSIDLARRTIEIIAKYLPIALEEPKNLEARYWLLYASAIAGIAFNNGLLHYTHALEHPLSGINPEVTHGIGLGVLLPAVIKHCHKALPKTFAHIYEPIVEDVKKAEEDGIYLAKQVEQWLNSVGLTEKLPDLGFGEDDIPQLVDLAFNTPSLDLLLSLAPVEATRERVEQIYRDSMKPIE